MSLHRCVKRIFFSLTVSPGNIKMVLVFSNEHTFRHIHVIITDTLEQNLQVYKLYTRIVN